MTKSTPIDCAKLRATLKKCQSDIKSDQQRIMGIEEELRHTKDPTRISKLREEEETRQGDITQAEALEVETRARMSGHC